MRNRLTQSALVGICLLAGFNPTKASAYPGGSPVSYGQNPLWSAGGFISNSDTIDIRTAPAGQTLVVTDVYFSLGDDESDWNCMSRWKLELNSVSSGETPSTLASFALQQYRHYGDGDSWTHGESVAKASFTSGLPIQAGHVLQLDANLRGTYDCSSTPRVHYTLSGYIAQS